MIAFDAILQAVLALLRASPALAGGAVYEFGEIEAIPSDKALAIIVAQDIASPEAITLSNAPLSWGTFVRLQFFARADKRAVDGTRPSSTLFAAAHARLVADPTLGGIAQSIDLDRVVPDHELTDTSLGSIVAYYRVTHRTTHDTLIAT